MNLTNVDKIEVKLKKDFPVIKETLSRMGIKNSKKKMFYPSCYCVEYMDSYYIIHFKELFKSIGKPSSYDENDSLRLDTIAFFLDKWGLVELIDEITEITHEKIHVLPKQDKEDYKIVHKFKFI